MTSPSTRRQANLLTEVVEDDDLEAATQRWVDKLLSWPRQHGADDETPCRTGVVVPSTRRSCVGRVIRALRTRPARDTKEAARAFVERRPPQWQGHMRPLPDRGAGATARPQLIC